MTAADAGSFGTGPGTTLEGQLLIAMPSIGDPRFSRTVIFLCAHSDEGAMGLIINKVNQSITFPQLVEQLGLIESEDIQLPQAVQEIPVHVGGPVETGRGFVLHSRDYFAENSSIEVTEGICLTATVDVLRSLVDDRGPDDVLMALGYAGWAPGQLEQELLSNGWLNCPADHEIVFGNDFEAKYALALQRLGISAHQLAGDAGHA